MRTSEYNKRIKEGLETLFSSQMGIKEISSCDRIEDLKASRRGFTHQRMALRSLYNFNIIAATVSGDTVHFVGSSRLTLTFTVGEDLLNKSITDGRELVMYALLKLQDACRDGINYLNSDVSSKLLRALYGLEKFNR